jgi:signal transduction histidine kinase
VVNAIGNSKWLAMSLTIVIVASAISISVLFYSQQIANENIRDKLFEKAKQDQSRVTRTIASRIGSDLDSIAARLQVLAVSQGLQRGDLTGQDADRLARSVFSQITAAHRAIDAFYILDKDNMVVKVANTKEDTDSRQFLGFDASSRDYVKETRSSLGPVFSNVFVGADGRPRITITYPIINRDSGQYLGLVGVGAQSEPFFKEYGNVDDFNSSTYLNVLDRNAVYVASPNSAIVGKSFFDKDVQDEFVRNDPIINDFYRKFLSGQFADATFDVGFGERLATGQPVIVNGKAAYFVTLGIPTSLIYSDIESVLAQQNTQSLYHMAGLVSAAAILIFFLIRLNGRLAREVSERTRALAEANEQLTDTNQRLREANEEIKSHDKMQSEFINIAAHELRTPIQPIVGMTEILKNRLVHDSGGKGKVEVTAKQLELIDRNAKRLQKLSAEILDTTRIESGTLRLDLEVLEMNERMRSVIADAKSLIPHGQSIKIHFKPLADESGRPIPLLVKADKLRIFEVVSNLLRNAIKFSARDDDNGGSSGSSHGSNGGSGGGGTVITITTDRKDGEMVVVSVKDQGAGISADIFPRLFTRFSADRERGGTGLGLFIAKNIVEAHGGRIWAENNKDGKGATFAFTLPLVKP